MIVKNNTTLSARCKALYPELFMSTAEREQANARLAEKMQADASAGLSASMEVNNQLGHSTDALWQVVAPDAIDAVSKRYFDLSRTSHIVESELPNNPAIRPTVQVEVVTDAGEALVNTTDWNDSALVNSYVPVQLDRFSRPFVLYNNDLMKGERIATKLAAAVEAVVSQIVNKFFRVALESRAKTQVTAATFNPEFVAQNLSQVFGDFGSVDDLILHPDFFAKLIPTTALSLGTQPGTYGIGRISCSAGLKFTPAADSNKGSTASLGGLALRKNGIAAAFGLPDMSNLSNVAVRSLGTVAGIPLILKSWIDAGKEGVYNSVEAMAGFAMANDASVHLLSVND